MKLVIAAAAAVCAVGALTGWLVETSPDGKGYR